MSGMNKLDVAQRAQILSMLCEGASMRSVSRLADVSFNTVAKLLQDAGRFCAGYHDAKVRGVKAKRVQVDEIWSFTYAKQKNVAAAKRAPDGAGDTWTWTAIEADTKLIISHFVGGRDGDCAAWFMQDVADRLANRVQLTSDGHKAYLDAVEGAFGADVDYAMLVKIYGASSDGAKGRYSPAECIGAQQASDHRQARQEARQHVLQRAREPNDADAQSALHAAHECLLKEIREPRAHGRDLRRLVQLDSHSQDASRHACDGRWPLENGHGLVGHYRGRWTRKLQSPVRAARTRSAKPDERKSVACRGHGVAHVRRHWLRRQ